MAPMLGFGMLQHGYAFSVPYSGPWWLSAAPALEALGEGSMGMASKWLVMFIREVFMPRLECFGDADPTRGLCMCIAWQTKREPHGRLHGDVLLF